VFCGGLKRLDVPRSASSHPEISDSNCWGFFQLLKSFICNNPILVGFLVAQWIYSYATTTSAGGFAIVMLLEKQFYQDPVLKTFQNIIIFFASFSAW